MATALTNNLTDRSFCGFLKATKHGDLKILENVYESRYIRAAEIRKTAMGETSGSVGGYLVPLDYSAKLMNTLNEESIFFKAGNVVPMTAAQTLAPVIDPTSSSGTTGVPTFFGGMQLQWGFEPAPAASEPQFAQITLNSYDLIGYSTVSNQFLNDVGAAGDNFLIQIFGQACAWYADFAFLNGTGTAKRMPLGILKSSAAIDVNRTTGNTIVAADIASMCSKLLPRSWRTAIWLCSAPALAKINALSTFVLNASGGQSLAGLPLYVTDKLPTLGTRGDLILIDPSLYVVGVRQEVAITVSSESPSAWVKNQSDILVWARLDGKPQLSRTVTLQDGATVVSPYVILN